MFPYDANIKKLKKYIDRHFQDCELIDYDRDHVLSDRQEANFDFQTLQNEFREDGIKIWMLLAEHIILRDSTILNRYQGIIKREAIKNITAYKDKKAEEQRLAKEAFKKQLKQNE